MPKLNDKYIKHIENVLFSILKKDKVDDLDIFRLSVIVGDLFTKLEKKDLVQFKKPNINTKLIQKLTELVEKKDSKEIKKLLTKKRGGRKKTANKNPIHRKIKTIKRRYYCGGEGDKCLICENETTLPPPLNDIVHLHPDPENANYSHVICRRCLILYIENQRNQQNIKCPICRANFDMEYINGELDNISDEARQQLREIQQLGNALARRERGTPGQDELTEDLLDQLAEERELRVNQLYNMRLIAMLLVMFFNRNIYAEEILLKAIIVIILYTLLRYIAPIRLE